MDETVAQTQRHQQRLSAQSGRQSIAEAQPMVKPEQSRIQYDGSAEVLSDTTEMGSDTDKEILQTDSESEIQSENDPEIQSEETVQNELSEAEALEQGKPSTDLEMSDMESKIQSEGEQEAGSANQLPTQPGSGVIENQLCENRQEQKSSLETLPDEAPTIETSRASAAAVRSDANTTAVQSMENFGKQENAEVNSLSSGIVEDLPIGQPGENLEDTAVQPDAEPEKQAEAASRQEIEPTVLAREDKPEEAPVEDERGVEEEPEAEPNTDYTEGQSEADELPETQPVEEDSEPEELEEQATQPDSQSVAISGAQLDAQSNVEIGIQLPSQPKLLKRRPQDTIIPPAPRFVRTRRPVSKPMLSSLKKKQSNVSLRSSAVLSMPYPIEQCGADMQRAFPGQIGRFYVTNAYCYAYSCNRMSIDMATESMGFEKRDFWGEIRPQDGETNEQQQQQQLQQQPQEPVASGKSIDRRMDDLERDLLRDPRLTLMIIKPERMNWNKLGNCLVFERCHPHRHYIADKWQMFLTLRRSATQRHMQMTTGSGKPFDYTQFVLYTANPGYYQRVLMQYLDSHPGVYILKRTNYSQGIGIRIYQAERPNKVDRLRECIGNRASLNQFVLQKYIERPLLVDKRKFDLRVYMMLLSCKRPTTSGNGNGFEYSYFAFSYPGYVKLSCYPYSNGSRDLSVHLTNQFVQKQRWSMYTRVKEATTWFPDELNDYLNRRGRTEVDWCKNTMYSRIRAIVGYVAAAFRPHLESNASPASVFRLYGPDFIVDENLNVWLLEVNTFPAYSKNTAALSGSIRNMWREAITVATETTLRYRNRLPVNGLTSLRNFSLAYSSEDPGLLGELVKQSFA